MTNRVETRYWLIGVGMLVALIGFEMIFMGDSAFSIVDHQAAGTAARVNEIQSTWHDEGYFGLQTLGMIGDLVFIVIYSIGTMRAGRGLRAGASVITRTIGLLVLALGGVFFATDITETSLQLVQMLMNEGSDGMAGIAAFMQPIKVLAWIGSFVAVLVGLLANRLSSRAA